MTPLQIITYYANLLILQYVGLPKAYGTIVSSITPLVMPQETVQSITFSPAPTSGTFVLSYGGISATTINWNDSSSTIQTDLQTIPALASVTVSGSIADGLVVNFVGVTPVAALLVVQTNDLVSTGVSVVITVAQTDQTLPLAVEYGFNPTTAIGVQLDVIGKYCGVTRYINSPNGSFTLDDADFLTLIQFAIVQNASGSSLYDIEANMNQFFPGEFIITDFKNMYMSYLLASTLGTTNLFTALVVENLIPRPMGVGVSVIIPPSVTDFFGFRTYNGPNNYAKPFNNYVSFNYTWLFLSYADAFNV